MKNKLIKEELKKIVLESLSIADICRALNIVPIGGNYKTIKSKLLLWNISTSHFTGQGWNVGIKYKSFYQKFNLIDIMIENSTYTNSSNLKKRLINEGLREEKCECCGLIEWLDKKIPLELHHKNGNNLDHRNENILILCPNCHAQTDNYRSKNINSIKNKLKNDEYLKYKDYKNIEYKTLINKNERKINYCNCGKEIDKRSKQCYECYRISERKVDRPSFEQLKLDIGELGYRGTGKKYGVSDNAIRKWLK